MANQITIDIGAAANDGTGDPLRTAFNYVNNNFSNVWNTGLPNSNVQFSDNRILTTTTNANLVLAPNGIGVVQSNVDIIPSINRGQSLGSTSKKWNTVNAYYINADVANVGSFGNLTVAVANLHITGGSNGYVLQTDGAGNLTWTAQTGGSGNGTPGGANTQVQFNDAGNFGGSSAFTFNKTSNVLTISGNITAGNIAITNLTTSNSIFAKTGSFSGDTNTGDNALYVGSPTFTSLGTDVMAQFTGNVTNYGQINFQNYSNSPTASGDYIATADNGNDTTHYIDMGITSSTWNDTQTNVLTGLAPNNGYLYVQDGNLSLGVRNGNTSYKWNFDTAGLLTVPGNIIPAGNNTQSLGSATSQWKDLWVSNNTIYINSVPLSVTAGNILTVNGEDVVVTNANGQANIGNLDITGTYVSIASGADETIITISPNIEGQAYLQMPDDATANVANVRLHNDAGNIELGTGSGSYNWYFDNTGNVTMPNGGYINFVNTGGIKQVVNEDFYIRGSDDEEDGWSIYNIIDDGAGNQLTKTQLQYNRFSVYTDVSGNNYSFDFRDTGEFDVPKSIRGPVGGNLVISIGDQFGSTTFIDLQTRSYVGDALISNIRIGDPNVTISTSSGAYNWTFGGTGNLTLPLSGNLVGATANNNGYLNWLGNSSGDNNGYTTLRLVPDDTRESADQYLIIDPTAPGHIHIRAGGTQDNSSAQLILGGENSYFRVDNGSNPNVYIRANNYDWTFGTDGKLTAPGISTGTGTGEIQQISGTRKIVGSLGTDYAYAASSAGHTAFGNVAWTASSSQVQSAKVTFAVQTNGVAYNWEQFDVAVCGLDSANAFVSVSNRVRKNSAIAYTEVSGYVNEGGVLEIWLNPADGQTVAFINYDAVEFNIMVD